MKKLSQRERVLNYIKEFGSITSYQAYIDLGITQLGARIFELKALGYEFKKETETKKNRFGENTHFDRYYLVNEMERENMNHIPTID